MVYYSSWCSCYIMTCICCISLQLVAKGFGRILQLHCQFFLTSSETLAHFTKLKSVEEFLNAPTPPATLDANSHNVTEDPGLHGNSQSESASKITATDPKPQTVDSPSGIRKQISSFLSKKLGSKSGSGEMSQSMFYVDVPTDENEMPGAESKNSMGSNLGPSGKESSEQATGGTPTQKELENKLQKLDLHDGGKGQESLPLAKPGILKNVGGATGLKVDKPSLAGQYTSYMFMYMYL